MCALSLAIKAQLFCISALFQNVASNTYRTFESKWPKGPFAANFY